MAYVYVLRHWDVRSLAELRSGLLATADHAALAVADDSDGEPPPLEADVPLERLDVGGRVAPPPVTPAPPECRECISLLLDLVPFLGYVPQRGPVDHGRTLLASAQDATLYLLQRLGLDRAGSEPAQLALSLLCDAEKLITPRRVRDAATDAHAPVAWALADLHAMIDPRDGDRSLRARRTAAARKLLFYARMSQSAPPDAYVRLQRHIQLEAARLEREEDERVRLEQIAAANRAVGRMEQPLQRMTKRVQVLE